MEAFDFYCPTRILFGEGQEKNVGKLAAASGAKRVMVVYGGQSAVKSGLLAQTLRALETEGLCVVPLGGVQPNPRLSLVREGIQKAAEFGVDFLLAIGGGSVIDTAKAIADAIANPGVDIWEDLWLQKKPLAASAPVGVILTIPAAGSECSDSAVLTNDATREKRGLRSDFHRPRFAILNPALAMTLPSYQIKCGTVDIMMHTLDRYFNPVTSNELTDEIAEGLLRNTIRNGRLALENPGDIQPISELMWAGTLSHNDLTGLGGIKDFAPHQLGHEISAMFDVAHGASLSAVWGSWARYCIKQDPPRFARYAQRVWGVIPEGKDALTIGFEGIEATQQYFRSLGMPISLPDLGYGILEDAVLDELAYRCTYQESRTIGSFCILGRKEIREIYALANSGVSL